MAIVLWIVVLSYVTTSTIVSEVSRNARLRSLIIDGVSITTTV